MPAIHLIERLGRLGGLEVVNFKARTWKSGYWKVSEQTARSLVEGDIYLHTAWADQSHFGGRITNYLVHIAPGEDVDQRIVFCFTALDDHKGVMAPPGANGEKRIFP